MTTIVRSWRRRRVLVALMAMAAISLATQTTRSASAQHLGEEVLVIETAQGPVTFRVEIADTPALRQTGLQNRLTLAEDRGMLFDFGETRRVAMWMKDTFIPLDMLFIDPEGVIVGIAAETEPHSLTPIPSPRPVRGVLELAGGATARHGISPGDRIRHSRFGNAATEPQKSLD